MSWASVSTRPSWQCFEPLVHGLEVTHQRLSDHAMREVLRALGVKATVHGMRSSFRDWASEESTFSREVCEQALAHATGNATEAAYRRGDALAKRAELMAAWAAFVAPE